MSSPSQPKNEARQKESERGKEEESDQMKTEVQSSAPFVELTPFCLIKHPERIQLLQITDGHLNSDLQDLTLN